MGRGVYRAAMLGLAGLWGLAHADSLATVDGRTYEDVYIDRSASMYYVRVPSDGTVVNILRSDVKPGSVVFSPRKTREALLGRWKAKQTAGVSGGEGRSALPRLPGSEGPVMSNAPRGAANPNVQKHGIRSYEQTNGVLHLTNRPDLLAKRSEGKTVYLDPSGVGLLTNQHERFRNDSDYVAVHIAFDLIEVPERFMTAPAVFAPSEFDEIVQYYARHHRLDPYLVYAVIRQESNFNASAVSHAGASGLMQLMPGTAAEMGVKDIFDPAQNIAGGTQYLAKMLRMFNNDLTLALAGYNAGPGNVMKYNGVPPFRETQEYIRRVQRFHREYSRGGSPGGIRVATGRHGVGGLTVLPPEHSEYIQLVLHNGAVTPAERISEKDTYYSYEFKHTTGIVQKQFVREVIWPTRPAD